MERAPYSRAAVTSIVAAVVFAVSTGLFAVGFVGEGFRSSLAWLTVGVVIVAPIVALVAGIRGIRQTRGGVLRGRGLAIAGTVVGTIGVVLLVLGLIALGICLSIVSDLDG